MARTTCLLFSLLAGPALGQTAPVVRIDADHPAQTIASFAAPDAWACQFVGQWPAAKKDAIADLLFSQAAGPGGQPKGIGLSMWRFNVALADSARAGQPLVSAYRSPDGRQLITVVVNDQDAPATLRLELRGGRRQLGRGQPYETSATADLRPRPPLPASQPLVVAPRSVTTLVSDLR